METLHAVFQELQKSQLITYECNFHGIACGPIGFTVVYVVKADTDIEEDSEYLKEVMDLDEDDNSTRNEPDEEIENTIEDLLNRMNEDADDDGSKEKE